MKTTEWFPASATPVHEGLYETCVNGFRTWSVWMDSRWHWADSDVDIAVEKAALGRISFWQEREWRGLTERT
jgi:hypothetical protein